MEKKVTRNGFTFELNKRFERETKARVVLPNGLNLINEYFVNASGGYHVDWDVIGTELVAKGGKIATRIRIWAAKELKVKLSKQTIENIGNIANMFVSKDGVFLYDFVDSFNWKAGDYGDGGSCYWGEKGYARTMLADHGSLAIRLYGLPDCECRCHDKKQCVYCENGHQNCECHRQSRRSGGIYELGPSHQYEHAGCDCECHQAELPEKERDCCGSWHSKEHHIRGIGRAWIVFPEKDEFEYASGYKPDDSPLGFIVYNAYGPHKLRVIADILAAHFNTKMRTDVHFYNNDHTDGTLWINGGGACYIGKHEVNQVNIYWSGDGEGYEYHCDACGRGLNDDEIFGEDEVYCESCYDEKYKVCNECDERVWHENAYRVSGEWYCEHCHDEIFTECEDCGRTQRRDDATEVIGKTGERRTVGDRCLSNYTRCVCCEEYHHNDNLEHEDKHGNWICTMCWEDNYKEEEEENATAHKEIA